MTRRAAQTGAPVRGANLLLLCVVLIGVAQPTFLGAQRVKEPRIGSFAAPVADTLPQLGRQPLPAGFVTQQAMAGLGGLAIGGLLGGLVGSVAVQDRGDGWEALGGLLVGMFVGGSVGSSWAVYRFSNGKGHRSSYAATLMGSVAGFVGGPLFWITVPVGGAIGYNAARK